MKSMSIEVETVKDDLREAGTGAECELAGNIKSLGFMLQNKVKTYNSQLLLYVLSRKMKIYRIVRDSIASS
jgi:hypothetical protein